MGLRESLLKQLHRLSPGVRHAAEKSLRRVPFVEARVQQEYDRLMPDLARLAKPYARDFASFSQLPKTGRPREEVLREMEAFRAREEARWKEGFVSGAVYHGDEEHVQFLNRVYALNSQSNPLHSDLWPSTTKFEAEIVAMTAHMLSGDVGVCGTVTSGGTESILLAMKTYRDWARDTKGISAPEIIAPETAHAAFDKAAEYFNIQLVRIPVGRDFRADVAAARRAINSRTVALVGSAPAFPHGVVDPIGELSELAREHGIGFHTDACLGGFLLPWAEKLGYSVPAFDFRLPGVTSISADTHKYGYAVKGTSVVLYRGEALRHYQYYTNTEWPGGLYFSPTFAGSRPGGLSAACWAAMVTLGEEGYQEAARKILETAAEIKKGVSEIPELRLLGDSLFVIAFTSESLDIFRVLDAMASRRWSLNGLHKPPAVHLCVTLRHAREGLAKQFVADLQASVDEVKAHPESIGGMAPMYGLAASLPLRGVVSDLLKKYLDALYRV